MIALAALVDVLLNVVGINPVTALVYSAVVKGMIAVLEPLLVLILLVANDRGFTSLPIALLIAAPGQV